MDKKVRERIAKSLRVKPEDIPDDATELKNLVEQKRQEYLEEVKHG